jgi:hypothetical protein
MWRPDLPADSCRTSRGPVIGDGILALYTGMAMVGGLSMLVSEGIIDSNDGAVVGGALLATGGALGFAASYRSFAEGQRRREGCGDFLAYRETALSLRGNEVDPNLTHRPVTPSERTFAVADARLHDTGSDSARRLLERCAQGGTARRACLLPAAELVWMRDPEALDAGCTLASWGCDGGDEDACRLELLSCAPLLAAPDAGPAPATPVAPVPTGDAPGPATPEPGEAPAAPAAEGSAQP